MDEKWCKELKDKLEMAFLECNKTKIDFAKEVGISYETLDRFLKGKRLYMQSLRKIVRYLEKITKKDYKRKNNN